MPSVLRHTGANKLVWIMLGMVMLGLGGYGVTNFSGGVSNVGSVDGRDISVNDYARALRREMRALSAQVGQPVTMEMVRALGVDRAVQARLFADAAFDSEAERLGVAVGDNEVRRRLLSIPAFQGLDGKFDRDAYRLTLEQNGLSESEFETQVRDEAARSLLQSAVAGGVAAPRAYVDTLAAWQNQTRDFRLVQLLPSDLPEPVPAPTEDEIRAYHDAHPDAFTRPETRNITYVWLTPEMLADKVQVDEAAVKEAYEARKSEFVTPEARLVERLVYPTEEEATAARARLDSGAATFADLAAERGLTLADVDMGEVGRDALGAAADAVFALTEPGVVGPLPSDLGPALFAMNGIIEAKEVSLDDAREELTAAVVQDRARRMISDETDNLADLLAGGATLEEVADETDMDLGSVAFNAEAEGGIVGYAPFRDAAAAVTAQDFPELKNLDDGGVFALRLDGIDPPAVKPLDEVRDEVIAAWTRDETVKRLTALAGELLAQIQNGATLETLGLVTTAYSGFRRDGYIADTPAEVVQKVFGMSAGESAAVATGETVHLLTLGGITDADPAEPEMQAATAALGEQARQGVAGDMLDLFTRALQGSVQITLNQTAIDAVQAQMQ